MTDIFPETRAKSTSNGTGVEAVAPVVFEKTIGGR